MAVFTWLYMVPCSSAVIGKSIISKCFPKVGKSMCIRAKSCTVLLFQRCDFLGRILCKNCVCLLYHLLAFGGKLAAHNYCFLNNRILLFVVPYVLIDQSQFCVVKKSNCKLCRPAFKSLKMPGVHAEKCTAAHMLNGLLDHQLVICKTHLHLRTLSFSHSKCTCIFTCGPGFLMQQ